MRSMRSSFRGIVVLALVAFAGCGKTQSTEESVETVRSNLIPDETGPIGQKWRKLVDAGVPIGEATFVLRAVPGQNAQYQTFINGVIVWTNDFGAVYLTQAIWDKWQSMTTLLDGNGNAVYNFFGVPTADYVAAAGYDYASFTAGMIAVSGGVGRAIYGAIYQKYATEQTLLGAPLNEETTGGVTGSRFQSFAGGEVYWYPPDGTWIGGTFTVFAGPILNKFRALGIATTGLPVSDSGVVLAPDGTARGLTGRFQKGTIYMNAANSAITFLLETALCTEFDRQGGPNGWLGFPQNDTTFTGLCSFSSTTSITAFWSGTTRDRRHAPVVAAFGNLTFHLQRVTALGDDCFTCGAQDLYYFLNVTSSAGPIDLNDRSPDSGDWGDDSHDANKDYGFARREQRALDQRQGRCR